jgi:hypothetical protein
MNASDRISSKPRLLVPVVAVRQNEARLGRLRVVLDADLHAGDAVFAAAFTEEVELVEAFFPADLGDPVVHLAKQSLAIKHRALLPLKRHVSNDV